MCACGRGVYVTRNTSIGTDVNGSEHQTADTSSIHNSASESEQRVLHPVNIDTGMFGLPAIEQKARLPHGQGIKSTSIVEPVRNVKTGAFSANEIKAQLWQQYEDIQLPHKFVHHQILKNAQNPHLFNRGAGAIGLPLSDRDIETIVSVCGQHTLSKNDAGSIVDSTSKNVWQVSSHFWSARNPSWERLLETRSQK